MGVEDTVILSNEELLAAVSDDELGMPAGWVKYLVGLKFLSPILGTSPADPKTLVAWRQLAASKGDRDKIAIIEDDGNKVAVEDGMQVELTEDHQGHTAFWKRQTTGEPCIMAYQFRGFLINATTVMKEDFQIRGRQVGKNADPIRLVRNNTQVTPFSAPIASKHDGLFGRVVRGMTQAGPRISINVSEVVLKPRDVEFIVSIREASGITQGHLEHIMEYGGVEGISQWRSGGWGRFKATVSKLDR
jgi:hypothetical protein